MNVNDGKEVAKNNKIGEILNNIQYSAYEIRKEASETTVEQQVGSIIREFRQGIERLRRLIEPEDKINQPLKFDDISKLGRDELAFIVDSVWDWYNENECPAERCDDYFCYYCQDVKERAEEELADGDMNAEDYNHLAKNGFYDGLCCGSHDGCWVDYYLWCYRNGVDPETGKKRS